MRISKSILAIVFFCFSALGAAAHDDHSVGAVFFEFAPGTFTGGPYDSHPDGRIHGESVREICDKILLYASDFGIQSELVSSRGWVGRYSDGRIKELRYSCTVYPYYNIGGNVLTETFGGVAKCIKLEGVDDIVETKAPCLEERPICELKSGNPINVTAGLKQEEIIDWVSPNDSRFNITRYFNSSTLVGDDTSFGLGQGWSSPFLGEIVAQSISPTSFVWVSLGNNDNIGFNWNNNSGSYSSGSRDLPRDHGHLLKKNDSAFGNRSTLTLRDGRRFVYDSGPTSSSMRKKVTEMHWPDGYKITIQHDETARPIAIEDNKGQRAEFRWAYLSGPIQGSVPTKFALGWMIDEIKVDPTFDGVNFQPSINIDYTYTESFTNPYNLWIDTGYVLSRSKVTDLISNDVLSDYNFTYQADIANTLLTGVFDGRLDEEGSSFQYAAFAYYGIQPISSSHFGGADAVTVGYSDDDLGATVTNSLGYTTSYQFETIANKKRLVGVEGESTASCLPSNSTASYDNNGRVSERLERNGSHFVITRDSHGRILTQTEDADGVSPRLTTYTYGPRQLRKPLTRRTAELKETFTYDANNLGLLLSYSQEDVLLGSPDFGKIRTQTYGYTTLASGLKVMTSYDGPGLVSDGVNDVTTYEYDALGRLTKTIDPNGLTVEVVAFGPTGQPTLVKDQKSFLWGFEYDLEGQLISSTFRPDSGVNDVTTFSYDIIGQMTSSTDSLGRTWTYTYNEARRLVKIETPGGEIISYEHDAMGNVTQTAISDENAVVKFLEETQYDELGRVLQALGSNNQSTQFSHDVEDNLSSVTDAIGFHETYGYDALNRLTSIVDRASATTQMEHDESDQTTRYIDPRGIETLMAYNGFGELVSENSADRGAMSYTYNNRGLVTSMVDARGVVTDYTYDDGGRIIWKKFPSDGALNQRFVYWSVTHSQRYNRGDLRYVEDQTGRTSFTNNTNRGYLQNDWRDIEGARYKVKYLTREENQLYRMEYPSRSRIYFYYNANGDVTKLRWFAFDEAIGSYQPSTTVIERMEYLPMGSLTSARFGDLYTTTSTYDSSYRLTKLRDNRGGSVLRNEAYDWTNRDNLASVTDNLNGAPTQSFVYTSREKLGGADGAWGEFDYSYDAVGNRTALTSLIDGTTALDLYAYPATSNQLQSVTNSISGNRTLTYDAAGNVTNDNRNGQGYSYTYDAANRMSTFSINGVVQAEYEYNFLGQQVIRRLTQTGETIHSVHDAAGNRIAEYLYDEVANTSSLIREYIWANNMLVGVFENGQMYFVRTDHIGRPVFATDTTGTKVWDASYLPFGGVQSSSGPNPSLRFPGQWFQSETGLHQNWMRDYDPTLGRYLQADPLGLVDGASIYGYALQNPGRYTDPTGEFIPIAIGFAIGAGLDLWQQLHNNGNRLQCVNWLRTGGAGAFGAFTGGFANGLLKGLGGIHRYKNWSSASRAFKSPSNLVGKGYETHHGIAAANGIRNSATWRNHFMNLRNLPKATHRRIHGRWKGADQFGPVRRWFYGTPEWLLGAEASAVVGALIEWGDGSCDCAN